MLILKETEDGTVGAARGVEKGSFLSTVTRGAKPQISRVFQTDSGRRK